MESEPRFEIETQVVKARPRMLAMRITKRWKGRRFVYRVPWHWKVEHLGFGDWIDPSVYDNAVDELTRAIDRQIIDQLAVKHGIGPVTRMLHREGLIHHGDQSW
jgi:hypothetical protein